jgi:hypothetical protein
MIYTTVLLLILLYQISETEYLWKRLCLSDWKFWRVMPQANWKERCAYFQQQRAREYNNYLLICVCRYKLRMKQDKGAERLLYSMCRPRDQEMAYLHLLRESLSLFL